MANTLSQKQKQSRFFGFLIFLVVLLIIGVILEMIKVTPYAVYRNQAAGIRMKYPASWKRVRDLNAPGLIVAFASPLQTAFDTYAENVNITFQDLSAKPMTLAQLSQLTMRQLTGTFQNQVKVVESEPAELAGRPAYRFSYIIVAPDPPRKFMHIWTIAGSKAYIFTYNGTVKDFDVFQGEVNAMIKSFTIL